MKFVGKLSKQIMTIKELKYMKNFLRHLNADNLEV